MDVRRFKRIRTSLGCTFAWSDSFERFRTIDVSAGGILVDRSGVGQQIPKVGVEGECVFTLENIEIRAQARVVRVSPSSFGLKFVGLPRSLEDRIVAWVLRQEALLLSRRIPR